MMNPRPKKKVFVALTGASGAPYFLRLMQRLKPLTDVDVHVAVSGGGRRVLREESNLDWNDLDLAGVTVHGHKDIGAGPASGSFRLDGMVVLPCSMNTLAAVAAGFSDNLITRAAAVQLKEDRKLILVPRETPLSLINLRAMVAVREAGAVVLPASPGFYHQPTSIENLLDTVVDRVLDHLNIDDSHIKRWNP